MKKCEHLLLEIEETEEERIGSYDEGYRVSGFGSCEICKKDFTIEGWKDSEEGDVEWDYSTLEEEK